MLIKVIWYDDYKRTTLQCIVASNDAAFCICDALDKSSYVRQWRLGCPEDTFVWYHQDNNNFKKLIIDPRKWDYK
ncbi:TPA: hypothetical protein ACOAY7_002933 [Vibrio cholerae]|nr:hypothetical protein 1992IndM4_0115 [Vibrio phage ICP1]QVV97425.1 hypothetical protein 2017DRC106_0115 [Vibrio phage ICP1]QVV97652.1 hypothetical protein 2017DRC32_0115 [Vibrio phage ICP1]QVV97879.1 hypothetical protein 2017DRC48_0115 [Vibrio phage ICP1]QVV98106.1 hypothetical protein 2017DRC55_0115 [Vibrio phage ICP1]